MNTTPATIPDMMQNDEIIFAYTRNDAINDGIFIDITEMAKEAGFKIPVAITSNLYHSHIKTKTSDEKGRLWDVLNVLKFHAKSSHESLIQFQVKLGRSNVKIWAVVEAQSPTDPSPAINLLLPEDY